MRDMIHLYPMWSAALQADVERFAVDAAAAADGADRQTPSCRTNAVVESHFKSVKHGRLDRRLRVRPRAFVSAELKYVLGKLNERKLPRMKVQRQKETASTEEKWGRRKRPARYADPAVATPLMKKFHRRATRTATAAPQKRDAPSAADHVAPRKARKKATTAQDATTAVPVTPVSTAANVQMKELGSDEITAAMEHLRAVYSDVDGLEAPGMGVCLAGHSVPRFQAVVRPFVQVLNIGDHWVTATNRFSVDANTVYWFDSLHGNNISPSTAMQLTSLLRRQMDTDNDRDVITVLHRACPLQYTWSRLCGYYALAAAYAVCSGTDPTGRDYDAQTMVDVIDQNLRIGRVDPVPPASRGPARTRKKQVVAKLHCHCQQPSTSSDRMIECSNCWTWYHVACVSATPRQLRRESAEWRGPCCTTPVTAPPIIVIDDTAPPQPSTSRTARAAQEPGN